jgi:BCD family chlorophyll transporter-like MFS transporter
VFLKRLQLALIHAAVAMTLVPINSTLNRVMIKEMAVSATLVAVLASLPYLFSPAQVLIGSYSDRHPWLGWRRTPYIAAGLLLCVAGVALAPQAVFLLPENRALGLILSLLTFTAWGMGYNLAAVSYLSLAAEIDPKGRSRTIAVMFFVMVLGIILTAVSLSRLLEPYSPERLEGAFRLVAAAAFALGLLGLFRLEARRQPAAEPPAGEERQPWGRLIRQVAAIPQARRFFLYLTLLLAAILGQDVLLEPYAGEAFNLTVETTTRITSIWGACMLAALTLANLLEKRLGKRRVAVMGAWTAFSGFVLIAASGPLGALSGFYLGVVLLGIGTGLATTSNLSLMLDMTTERVGLFIGAWGVANALSRLLGTVLGGAVRDLATAISADQVAGYVVVFIIEALLLVFSLLLLRRIDVRRFQEQSRKVGVSEQAALLNEAS